ncbi:MAG: TetR/AcrR family transcriptional regulator [Acidimicrobiia bacterium]
MARPRAFSEEHVLDQAMETFWVKGYEATSIEDLTEATGLSRSSLYQAFDNKRGLLDAALGYYNTERVGYMLSGLEGTDAGLDEIVGFFNTLAAVAEEYPERFALGCLTTNTIAELGKTDPAARSTGDEYINRYRRAFDMALRNAERRGEVTPGNAEARSELLTTLVLGAFIRARGNPDPKGQLAITGAVTALVDSWKTL